MLDDPTTMAIAAGVSVQVVCELTRSYMAHRAKVGMAKETSRVLKAIATAQTAQRKFESLSDVPPGTYDIKNLGRN